MNAHSSFNVFHWGRFCVGYCAGFLQFLIRASLFVFRLFIFPVFFCLALSAFLFFALSFYAEAIPSDQLPADKKPAQSCQLYGLNYDPNSNGPNEYRDCQPIAVYTHYYPSAIPQYFSIGQACSGTLKQTPTGYEEAKYSNGKVFLVSQTDSYHQFQYRYPGVYSDGSIHPSSYGTTQNAYVYKRNAYSYLCPPTGHPEYDQLVESDEGQKYCLKSAPDNQCEEKAGQILSAISKYYKADSDSALQSDCEGSCEVVAASVGICADYVMPSGTVILQCSVAESKYTGNPCPYDLDGESPIEQYDEAKPKEPNSEKTDCVYQYNAALGQSECTGVETVENPGTKSCGHINGVFTCVDNGDGCNKTTTTEKTKKETTDPETGNVTTTETATVTTETCKGDSCTTKTATTTTSTTVNGSGSVVGSTSSCTGDGCGAGTPGDGGGLGDLYTPTDQTYRSVVDDFRARISAAPVLTSLGGFLTIGASGSCPVWSVTIPVFGAITIDQQCSEVMAGIWVVISAVLLATAAFFSFRIAFL